VGGAPWDPSTFGRSTEYPELPRLAYWVVSVLLYGFGEEVGWRGYALLQLQRRRSAFMATFQLSLIWALWHLPLFAFAPGLSRMGSVEVLGWYFSIVTGAVLFTWLMNSTGSIAIVAVFHGVMDIVFVAPAGPLVVNILGALITVWGVMVLAVCGPGYLARRGKVVLDEAGTLVLVSRSHSGVGSH
jgi:membrane protease YdiL (CAAX protease family)